MNIFLRKPRIGIKNKAPIKFISYNETSAIYQERLNPAKGLIFGLILSAIAWVIIGYKIYSFL